MDTLETYLTSLVDKIFKLLPLREALDKGEHVCLYEYIETLRDNYLGAYTTYPILSENHRIVEVDNNLAFLYSEENIEFKKWRKIVLGSVRLIRDVISEYGWRYDK